MCGLKCEISATSYGYKVQYNALKIAGGYRQYRRNVLMLKTSAFLFIYDYDDNYDNDDGECDDKNNDIDDDDDDDDFVDDDNNKQL